MTDKSRMIYLTAEINRHQKLYDDGEPEIPDSSFDAMMRELIELEEIFPEWAEADSPTKRVGGLPVTGFIEITHLTPMLSLDKVHTYEDLDEFCAKVHELLRQDLVFFSGEPKLDGIACGLVYTKGLLDTAATRGDGKTGDLITHQAHVIRTIPNHLRGSGWPAQLEVCGEIYMPIKPFEVMNNRSGLEGGKTYANPRNGTAGIIRQFDPAYTARWPLKFTAYRVAGKNQIAETHTESMALLKSWGFDVSEPQVLNTIKHIREYCEIMLEMRDNLPMEIDGLVFKVNRIDLQNQLGEKSKHPRWAISFKFPPVEEQTKLLDMDVQLGRTGVLTPMARVEPVRVGGVEVSNATLFNFAHVRKLKLKVGDDVVVRRAGDVVPQLAWSIQGRIRDEYVPEVPDMCPLCSYETVEDASGALYCFGPDCTTRIIKHLAYAVSRNVLDINGIGEGFIKKAVHQLGVRSIPDLFRLNEEQLETITKSEEQALVKMSALEAAREQTLERLIMSLGIPECADGTSSTLARFYPSLFTISIVPREELMELPDIGGIVADHIVAFFETNHEILLAYNDIFIVKAPPAKIDSSMEGKSYVVSGKRFGSRSRAQMEEYIQLRGGKLSGGVSKNTTELIAGLDASDGKIAKANKLGVPVSDGSQFD